MGQRPPRPCLTCTRPTQHGSYCPTCRTPGDPEHRRPNKAQRYPPEYWHNRAIILAAHPRCHWCPRQATTADHLIEIALGGTHDLTNLVPACAPCNSARGGQLAQRRKTTLSDPRRGGQKSRSDTV